MCAESGDERKDPAYGALSSAFELLKAYNYDAAIARFRDAARLSPLRSDIRKNLAYALLKTGESEAARQEFGVAMKNDPADLHVALEYAFLCYEARENAPAHRAEARRIFARVRDTGSGEVAVTAAQAFENVDRPLREGITRWQQALAVGTPTFSAHYELAQLAEARDELGLAAVQYLAAFQMSPERKSVLLELARVETARNNPQGAMSAWLAASRGGEPRAAEVARELLPERYPFVYEFRQALELDPGNAVLHRELAYLLLQMSEQGQGAEGSLKDEAREEFRKIAERFPEDQLAAAQLGLLYLGEKRTSEAMPILEKVLASADAASANRVRMALKMPLVLEEKPSVSTAGQTLLDPRILGERSYAAGFLKDARRYYLIAREQNPVDSSLALKLGWTNNMLHDDPAAIGWFDIARKSDDPAIAGEAERAYGNLRNDYELFRTTVWIFPLFSSRWGDVFGYGQVKTELRLKKLPFHIYGSVRLAGDVRRKSSGVAPENLSESAFIAALGVASNPWHGATGWFEAGTMIGYLNGQMSQDYRGGVTYTKTRGSALGSESTGWFAETTDDSVYISRFDRDLINYSQNKTGYTSSLLGVRTQAFWNNNITVDVKKQYWANTVETGPGFRFLPPHMPAAMNVTVSAVRGIYLHNAGNPRGPNFIDFRVGVWYAFTR